MYYNYNINGKKTQCYYGKYSETVTVYDQDIYNRCGEYPEIPVVCDENGEKCFEFNGEKIMFGDYFCYTPSELVENFSNVREYNLCQTLMKYGIDSVRVMLRKKPLSRYNFGGGLILSFDVSSSRDNVEDYDWVEYQFVNEYMSNPEECYKLKMIPVDEKLRDVYGSERTYASDLVSLIQKRTDLYQIKSNVNV